MDFCDIEDFLLNKKSGKYRRNKNVKAISRGHRSRNSTRKIGCLTTTRKPYTEKKTHMTIESEEESEYRQDDVSSAKHVALSKCHPQNMWHHRSVYAMGVILID